jgi:hypothetical protein
LGQEMGSLGFEDTAFPSAFVVASHCKYLIHIVIISIALAFSPVTLALRHYSQTSLGSDLVDPRFDPTSVRVISWDPLGQKLRLFTSHRSQGSGSLPIAHFVEPNVAEITFVANNLVDVWRDGYSRRLESQTL